MKKFKGILFLSTGVLALLGLLKAFYDKVPEAIILLLQTTACVMVVAVSLIFIQNGCDLLTKKNKDNGKYNS